MTRHVFVYGTLRPGDVRWHFLEPFVVELYKKKLAKLTPKELETEMDSVRKRIFFLAGREFNINSPKQLAEVLF